MSLAIAASFSSSGLSEATAFLDQPSEASFGKGKGAGSELPRGYLDKVAFKHRRVREQVEFWRMNQLTKKAIFHPKFHSRAWFPDLRWEAPNFTHWFLGRTGWGPSLGLHADPAQFRGVGVTTTPPHLHSSTSPPDLQAVHQAREGLSAHNDRHDIKECDG